MCQTEDQSLDLDIGPCQKTLNVNANHFFPSSLYLRYLSVIAPCTDFFEFVMGKLAKGVIQIF